MITVFKNARIYTMDCKRPWAKTLVIKDGKIVYVGNSPDLEGDIIYDLEGKMVIPSFIDSHAHPGFVSKSAWHIRMPLFDSIDEILLFIKKYAEDHPKEEAPFLYFDYYQNSLFDKNGPKKGILDAVVSDRPCLVQDFSEHTCWVNSKMLELLEVTKDTKDPVPGIQLFYRDESGELTGWIKEAAWWHFEENLYRNLGWKPPIELTPENMELFYSTLTDYGITAIFDALLENESQIKSTFEMETNRQLNLYYDGSVRCDNLRELPDKIALLKEYHKKYGHGRIKVNTMKVFIDGTNSCGTSASLYPFENDLSGANYGSLSMEKDELAEYFLTCNRENLDVHLHVVGDRGFRVICDAAEAAQRMAGNSFKIQITLAHCELIDAADIFRPVDLGLLINATPHWMGGYFGEESIQYIGRKRWEQATGTFNPLIEAGVIVAFSSDTTTFFEFNRTNPFFGMQIGNTKVDIEYPLDPVKYPGSVAPSAEQKIARDALLRGYTINGAKQLRLDHLIGSIEAGKLANINILSDNFFTVSSEKIKNIKCETVIFEGRILRGKL